MYCIYVYMLIPPINMCMQKNSKSFNLELHLKSGFIYTCNM